MPRDMPGMPQVASDTPVGTSPWWIDRLSKILDNRAAPMRKYEEYYRGKHPLLYAGSKYRAAFGNLFSGFADNFCGLVVNAVEERLDVEGFRMGSDESMEADKDAWSIWQSNNMDARSQVAHVEALVKGETSVLVWADPDDSEQVQMTVQDALQMAIGYDRATGQRLAALKRFVQDDGTTWFTLYLPDTIEKYQTLPKGASNAMLKFGRYALMQRKTKGENWPLRNPLGIVPVVPLVNLPHFDGTGESEIASVLPLQNALNKLFLDMLVAAEYAAFRQRWAVGLELEIDPDTGKAVEPFRAEAGRLWTAEDAGTKFGDFEVTDLGNYVKAIETTIQHIATITSTPPHYLLGSSGSFPSGESLEATETGLVAKAKRKQRFLGEGWEEVIRLAFLILDDPKGKITDSETLWRDPESRDEAAHIDALVKLGSLGVPEEMLWEMAGLTPQQIERAKKIIAAEPPPPVPTVVSEVSTAAPPAVPGAVTPVPAAAGGGFNGAPLASTIGVAKEVA